MKVVFAGTPEFAATALKALLDAGPEVGFSGDAAYTQPDRPAGRSMKLTAFAVKQLALSRSIPVVQPPNLAQRRLSTSRRRSLGRGQHLRYRQLMRTTLCGLSTLCEPQRGAR